MFKIAVGKINHKQELKNKTKNRMKNIEHVKTEPVFTMWDKPKKDSIEFRKHLPGAV